MKLSVLRMGAAAAALIGMSCTVALAVAPASASPATIQQERTAGAAWMGAHATNHEWKLVTQFAVSGQHSASTWTSSEISNLQTTTDYARFILGLLAAGLDPHNYQGKNYVQALAKEQQTSGDNEGKFADNMDGTGFDQVNAQVWSIIALEAAGNASYNRASAAAWLISHQNKDGGFGWSASSTDSDPDDTAYALDALSLLGYTKDSQVVSRALQYLQTQQAPDGGFGSADNSNSDSTAVVVEALEALGINPDSWVQKNGVPSTALTSYFDKSSGGFVYDHSGQSWSGVNETSTRDALFGLSALATHQSVYQRLHWKRLDWLNTYWSKVYQQGGAWLNGHFLTFAELRPMAVAGSYVSDLTPAWQKVVKARGMYVQKNGKKVWEAWDVHLATQALVDSFGQDTAHLNGLA
ncbi:hypothetical protein GCM10025857_14260 [Alicyclobacillus contaminans]|uniref:prenyltransferase/squalene oxidase repeat-containing protein n=1 Tax=Alicyclobacillus contaminans TaxID=392016 RepID=UPI0003FF5E0D|nr:prenyltransferase/squalene oxidase repeat-containing protein [Alicyclobacillus contaminans]GMA50069.1 hypothetical protein GCM10025857_14260 [Alicyclobacillus contaminans]